MKIFLIFISTIFSVIVTAQNNSLQLTDYDENSEYYIIDTRDQRIDLQGRIVIKNYVVHQSNKLKTGKEKSTKYIQEDLKFIVLGDKVYTNVVNEDKKRWLEEVVAFNSKYVLTAKIKELANGYVDIFTVRDRDLHIVQEPTSISVDFEKAIPRYKKKVKEKIEPYFEECTDFLTLMDKNLDNTLRVWHGIANYNCGNASELFPTIKRPKKIYSSKTNLPESVNDIEENYSLWKKEKTPIPKNYPSTVTQYKSNKNMQLYLKDLKYLIYDKKMYLPFKLTNNFFDLYEVIAYNDKYILAYDLSEKFTYHICDRQYNVIEKEVSKEEIIPKLEKYFAECTDLIQSVKKNLPQKKKFKNEFNYYNCGNAPLLTY